jgi:hypothetical protein
MDIGSRIVPPLVRDGTVSSSGEGIVNVPGINAKIAHVTEPTDDELRALRERAYRRDSDIHLDPESLMRLRELESRRGRAEPEAAEPETAIEAAEPETTEDDVAPVDEASRPPARWVPLLRRFARWLSGLRRSTVLIALGSAAVIALIATALVLVERVQTDPLQVGAVQVARLTVDQGYDLPPFFSGFDGDGVNAYTQFHGLRAVTNALIFSPAAANGSTCLTVYAESDVTDSPDSFSGPLFGGCGAGAFPAIVQFSVDVEQLPEDLVAAFPETTGLQFVYDSEHDEVVVFADRT